jgi:hypothetical protein
MAAAKAAVSGEDYEIQITDDVTFTITGGSPDWAASIELARFAKEQASLIQSEQAGSIVALADSFTLMLGADQYQELLRLGLSVAEVMVLINRITELKSGADVGEAPGSAGNSRSSGGRPRLISSTSTGSTSAEPASVNPQNGSI